MQTNNFSMSLLENLRKRPMVLGELLRNEFFNQDDPNDFGCVSTFDVRSDVVHEEDLVEYESEDDQYPISPITWKCFYKDVDYFGRVYMRYYWDGDGTLEFNLEDPDIYIVNNDCKKTYCWFEIGYGMGELK